jgi:hypothetical protein
MTQDSEKPLMPRRPVIASDPLRPVEKRKPEKLKPLRKRDKANPEQVEADCLSLTVTEKACAIICVEKDKEAAAIQLNMSLTEVQEILDSAPVRLFLSKMQDEEIKELAKTKVRRMRKVGICKANIEERLMQLMMLDPTDTKGTLDGQVKAASLLLDKCGYGNEKDPLEGKTPEELRQIVSHGHKLIEGKTGLPVN